MTMPKKNNRPSRDVKPVFRIYCEGEKTEPNYFNGYIDKFFSTLRPSIKVVPTKKNTPVQLVKVAVKEKSISPDWDFYWVVYDRESEQKYKDKFHAQAYDKAKSHNISVAISNVCFEVWLLLHFCETTASYSNYDDLIKNSTLRVECKTRGLRDKRGQPDYDKADQDIFRILTEKEITDARTRAKKINRLTEQSADPSSTKPYQWTPYTDVYKLLDAIDDFAEEQGVKKADF